MDEVLDFFNAKKPLVRKNVFGGTSSVCKAQTLPTTSPANQNNDKCANDTKYAESYATENDARLIEKYGNNESSADEEFCYRSVALYRKYNFKCKPLQFPILKHRDEILQTIENNCFTILQGPTGCGKTTQLPQYILDEAYATGKRVNMIVAQPTRIAASSNATRICDERKLKLGQLIGYKIGFDENMYMNKDTRVLFCTTGVLLSKLIRAKSFGDWTHIILDEIHERNIHMDFLFVIIRKLLAIVEPRPKIKFILMSATIQAEQFSNYFTFPKDGRLQPAPIITIQHRSKFTISEFFLEHFIEVAPKIVLEKLNSHDLNISDELFMIALHLICRFDKIDGEYFSDDEEDTPAKKQTVLVFLPGIHEIARMESILKEYWIRLNKETKIMPVILHSTSDSQQRSLIFQNTDANVRKIILATNIAESSITVPNVKYVLDFCRTKLLVTDSATNFTSLQLSWASRSNCKQRAGRSGRVMNGRVYRFVRKDFYDNNLNAFAIPEIVSSPLENVILSAKLLDMGSPASLLSLAMDKPKLSDIANNILLLKEIGALLRTCNGTWSDMDGDISLVGKHMANLPIDVRIAKFIILGYCFSILNECIIIGTALNSKSFFKMKNNGKADMRHYSQQLSWANGSGSDLVASLHAYMAWQSAHSSGLFGQSNSSIEERLEMKEAERAWGHKYCLDIDALNECRVRVNELKARLEKMNIQPSTSTNDVEWNANEKAIILKVVIAGAFYPNYFVRTSSVKSDDQANDLFKAIGTRDPRTTVYYTGFPREFCRQLYIKSIKEIFIGHGVVDRKDADRIRVTFDPSSNKMFITFETHKNRQKDNLMPGSVSMEVYKALKLRDLKLMCDVWVIGSIDVENNYAKQINFVVPKIEEYYESRARKELNDLCIPKIFDVNMKGFITHVDSCDRFWFQSEIESVKVQEFEDYLKNYRKTVLRPLPKSDDILQVGKLLIVALSGCSDFKYHRAKIVSFTDPEPRYKVKLIDFGEVIDCSENQFFEYCGSLRKFIELPPRCFECGLAEVQPSQIRYDDGLWPNAANDLLRLETKQRLIEIVIYSLTNGKAKVFVKMFGWAETLNDILIKKHFGEYVEEDFISKTNHIQRKTQREQNLEHSKNENFIDPMYLDYLFNKKIDIVEPPPPSMCNKKYRLSGPYSPISSKVLAITEAIKNGTATIDRFSVNSILIDNDPQDSAQKTLVAASVCYSNINKMDLSLRNTTLMPNIRGFGALSALIFCPTMQIKTNETQTNYTALLTGLGYDNVKKRPVFAEHDMQFHLDVEITQHDIEIINHIRYNLDTLLLTCSSERPARKLSENAKYQVLNKIKSLITKLLEKPRKSIDIDPNTNIEWDPNFEKLPDFRKSVASDVYGRNAIYPLHGTLQTKNIRDTNQDFLRLQCKQLHVLAKISTTLPANVSCKLCKKDFKSLDQLKKHLTEHKHINNELHIELSEATLI